MEKIALITDSSSDIDRETLEKYNINLLPFRIIYSDKEYEDKVEISAEEVYNSLSKEIPTTSLPSMEKADALLTKLEEEGFTHVLAITISSGLSGTCNSLRLILEEHPKLKSYVFDTKTLTLAQGMIVIRAAKMIEEGKSFDEIVNQLPKLRKNMEVFFTLSTLEYLKKGGRIGKVAGTVGELLNLKPIIHVGEDGIYHTYSKVRGRKQSLSKLQDIAKEYINKGNCNIWVLHGDAEEEGKLVFNSIKDLNNVNSAGFGIIGPALGVHTGPGLIGVFIEKVD